LEERKPKGLKGAKIR